MSGDCRSLPAFACLASLLVLGMVIPAGAQPLGAERSAGGAQARLKDARGAPVLVRDGEREWLDLSGRPHLQLYDYLQTGRGDELQAVVAAAGGTKAAFTLLPDSAAYLTARVAHEENEQDDATGFMLQMLRGSLQVRVDGGVIGVRPGVGHGVLAVRYGELMVRIDDGEVELREAPDGAVLVWASRGWARVTGADGRERLAGDGRALEYRPDGAFRHRLLEEPEGPDGWLRDRERRTAAEVVRLLERERRRYYAARADFNNRYRELLGLRESWYNWMRAARVGRAVAPGADPAYDEIRALLAQIAAPMNRLERSIHRIRVLARYLVQVPMTLSEELHASGDRAERSVRNHTTAQAGVVALVREAARERRTLTGRLHTVRHIRKLSEAGE